MTVPRKNKVHIIPKEWIHQIKLELELAFILKTENITESIKASQKKLN